MQSLRTLIIIVMCFLTGDVIWAQEKFSAEFRPGISFPFNKIAGNKVNTGYGLEVTLAYEVLMDVGIYAGWGWNKFDTENVIFTERTDIEESGYTGGIQFKHRIKNSSLSYLIRGGAVYNHLDLKDNEGEPIAESDNGIGWQAEAGLTFEIGNNWDMRPTIRYRSLPGNLKVFNGQMSVDLQYISLGLGLAKKF